MPTTPNLGLPYPGLTNAPNGPADIQALAVALDAMGVVFAQGDTASAVSTGGNVISAVTLPAVSHATRVFIQVEGEGGFASGATAVGLQINGGTTVTQRTGSDLITVGVGLWIGLTRSGYMDIPADTTGSVGVTAMVSAAASFFKAAMTLTRVNI
jgi:hypothetical protein